jgi:membrane associated rhomboid family serine protease
VSVAAFSHRELFAKLLFNPYQVYHRKEWYRLVTHGVLHADWMHLIVNMLVLFSFGIHVEHHFAWVAEAGRIKLPALWYVAFYLLALVISSLTTLRKHKEDVSYNSVGASGAVSAVLFCNIFFEPHSTLLFMGVIPVKAYLFGPLYLIYSYYSARKNSGNINHDAHLLGAVFGFCFPLLIDIRLFEYFISQLTN